MLKKHRFKITVIMLTILFILSMHAMTAMGSNAASPAYQMFVNDRAFPGTLERDSADRFFVPVFIFEHLNVKMDSIDYYKTSFVLQRNNKLVSFNMETGKAYNERSEEVDCPARMIRGQPYVSAYRISALLDLQVPEWKGGVLRIKDYTAKRTMDEMLNIYAPKAVITTSTAPAATAPVPATAPPTTTIRVANLPPTNPNIVTETTSEIETTTPENTRDINNYLMFDTGNPQANSDNLETIINFLDDNKIRAIFFLTCEEIAANPGKLREIFASGHDIGIKIDRSDYENRNDLVSEVGAANAYIYSLVKQKSRIYRITADFEDVEYMKDCMASLKRAGYYPCPNHINPEPENFEDIDVTIDFLKQRQVNLFAFDLNNLENNYQYLELTAQAVNAKFYIHFSHINNANITNLK